MQPPPGHWIHDDYVSVVAGTVFNYVSHSSTHHSCSMLFNVVHSCSISPDLPATWEISPSRPAHPQRQAGIWPQGHLGALCPAPPASWRPQWPHSDCSWDMAAMAATKENEDFLLPSLITTCRKEGSELESLREWHNCATPQHASLKVVVTCSDLIRSLGSRCVFFLVWMRKWRWTTESLFSVSLPKGHW